MTINVNISAAYKPYNNCEVKDGETLVPILVDDNFFALHSDVDTRNLRTWCKAGKKYLVAFYPIPPEFAKIALQQFYYNLNELLGVRGKGRCLIPQPNGSYKVCPKKNGDNHPDCAHCPHNGAYIRKEKTVISLDALIDENESFFTTDETNPVLLKAMYEELLTYLADRNPRILDIVTTGFDIGSEDEKFAAGDYQELVQKVMKKYGIKKSRAYQFIQEARTEVERFFQD